MGSEGRIIDAIDPFDPPLDDGSHQDDVKEFFEPDCLTLIES